MSRGDNPGAIALRFFLPPPDLQPFVTTLYHMDVAGADGEPIEDWLHPEWANLRLILDDSIQAAIGTDRIAPLPRAVLTGPTSITTHFVARTGRSWGIGLLPLGWARLTRAEASDYADRLVDAAADPEFEKLGRVCGCLDGIPDDLTAQKDCLVEELRTALATPAKREDDIVRTMSALVDPDVRNVAQLADSLEMSARTMERFCRRVFGFNPQLLLRRQRFVRSLAQFMLDPSLKWIETLDANYHDQAHFVRDFKRFMCMSPSEYARLPHPVLLAAAHARTAVAGEAMQALHKPPAPPES